ncbi:hypothetical protein [Sinorhizobium sp. BG8]|uniref:hypothetical protein n=1 Tax=Sinorhizobium sp. BG8 TaxID=2613773 RepID=UPI00193CF54A|nr:hypothetical protein [Sinorhizobium sp. BG8]QRM53577.1 hypothetical protein F3Y30_02600 [Sinorhizobium sp. BG8]
MADKSTFTPDEWNLLLESVMIAGIAVTAADPSGLWGMLKEGMASSRTLLKAKTDAGADPLISALVSDFETSEGRSAAREGLQAKLKGSKPDEVKTKCIAALQQAADLVSAKAPDAAGAYKAWLYQISVNVAEAAKEGGFLGFGGVEVSDAEKATLAEISTALKLDPSKS